MPKIERLYEKRMEKALRLEDYQSAAESLDRLHSLDAWKREPRSAWYDHVLLSKRYLAMLEVLREGEGGGDGERMAFLRSGAVRSFAGSGDMRLLRVCSWGTKELVENYVQMTVKLVQSLYLPKGEVQLASPTGHMANEEQFVSLKVKEEFFVEMLQSYGRTALVLHGGASFGASHLGVCKALHEQGLLPKILLGSYIGALVAALICVTSEAELAHVLTGEGIDLEELTAGRGGGNGFRRKAVRFLKYGHVFDIHVLEEWSRKTIGDVTFAEAFQRSQRILNIPVWSNSIRGTSGSTTPMLLNHVTSPDVLVWSAACAACALPGLYEAVGLLRRDPGTGVVGPWSPSAIRMAAAKVVDAVPLGRLRELFNANQFIVSHVPSFWSPRLPASLNKASKRSPISALLRFLTSETEHRVAQLTSLGLFPWAAQRLLHFLQRPGLGDIRMQPEIAFRDLKWVLGTPTPAFLKYCLVKGERAAWPWLRAVWVRCAVENELDRALSHVRYAQQ